MKTGDNDRLLVDDVSFGASAADAHADAFGGEKTAVQGNWRSRLIGNCLELAYGSARILNRNDFNRTTDSISSTFFNVIIIGSGITTTCGNQFNTSDKPCTD